MARMAHTTDGGPAFPCEMETHVEYPGITAMTGTRSDRYPGMSLRDYFAAKAMAALLGNNGFMGRFSTIATRDGIALKDCLALECYLIADAMLRARVAERKE